MGIAKPFVWSLFVPLLMTGQALQASAADAEWIWLRDEPQPEEVVFFRKTFEVAGPVKSAKLATACDNELILFINGRRTVRHDSWQQPALANVADVVKPGTNVIAVRGRNAGSAAGFILRLELELESGGKQTLVTDKQWRVSGRAMRQWQEAGFDDSDWQAPHSFGALGVAPWGQIALAPGQLREPRATPTDQIRLPEGFRVELLYSVPQATQGSWVSMTTDPQGRLLVSDQYGGLYRVAPGDDAETTRVESLDVQIGHAQGLLYAFDSLYVMVNGNAAEGAGLYRVRDTDGDDRFDKVELLRSIEGGGEHGPHAIVLAPDGKSLYVCAGNHTNLPEVARSRVPANWQEDQLLPRMWDAGGHAVGRMAPGGWICRTDPDGKSFELISSGYRNEYDIAFNPAGALFTYDADMEWDIGSPWYRPTRICHATSGSEYGWRSGTGKWPPYYPDSLPAAVDIGPGSPTGIVFGTGARFPAKYQRALFVADWSYGLIYAVHLEPDGSTYRGTFERFATASPLPVTDLVVRPQDGALYFTIGGRRTQSGLYRVTYAGDASTEPASHDARGQADRQLRQRLEAFHGAQDADAVAAAWPHLAHADRFIRYAARVAVEHQDVATWQEAALAETRPQALLEASIALARCGDQGLQPRLIEALGRLEWSALTTPQKLAWLRAHSLAFIRMGRPDDAVRGAVLDRFDRHYPADDQALNRELCTMLVYLEAPGVSTRTLDLLAKATTQEEEVHYVLCLRALKDGWQPGERRRYFEWFTRAGSFRGGHSFSRFLVNIRNEAIATLDDKVKQRLQPLLEQELASAPPEMALEPRAFVKKWKTEDLLADVEQSLEGRDLQRGRELFAAAACFKCHRFEREGGIIGPDLTSVGKRFTPRYILESLTEPSKAVSDQYQATIFLLTSGQQVVGKVANLSGNRLSVITDMMEPGKFTSVNVDQIEEQMPSSVSMMPSGLLDTLTRDEILDLIAYLRSGGQ